MTTNLSEWVKAGISRFDWLSVRRKEMLLIFLLSLLAWTITFFPIKYWSLVGIDATSSGYHRWVLTLLWTSFSYLIVFGGAEKWRQLESFSHLRQLADDERIVLQA